MARTVKQVQALILNDLQTRYAAIGVTFDPSTVSIYDIENLISYVVAVAIVLFENILDTFRTEVNNTVTSLKTPNQQWFVEKAKAFQYGYSLYMDFDYYNNTGLSEATIAASKVIVFAACEELQLGVRLKLAALDNNGKLAPVPTAEFNAFKQYMERVKPAGVHLDPYYVNESPDSFKGTYLIGYDPLVLNANGERLDGTNNTPVQDAIAAYLETGINFNGLFAPAKLVDAIQAVPGVRNVQQLVCQARYGGNPFSDVYLNYRPFAGYMRVNNPSDLILQFLPHEPV